MDPDTGFRSVRTGDFGFLDADGILSAVSRQDTNSIVQLREYFVDLVDVSRSIIDQSHGKVAETVVVRRQDDKEQLEAFIVMSIVCGPTILPYLQVLLRGLPLPAYLRPTRAVALNFFPLTRDGKVDQSKL
jgi:acyl-coenzyme A synthetase/AMP-(fatty) acid ligase